MGEDKRYRRYSPYEGDYILNPELNLQHSVKEIKTAGTFQPYCFSCCYDAM